MTESSLFRSISRWIALAMGLAVAIIGPVRAAKGSGEIAIPDSRASLPSKRAAQGVLLGAAYTGKRLVAVGERGIVLISDDAAANWHQVPVPTSVTLTAVRFASPKVGWAVGHYGIVLKTVDGGNTWLKQLDGVSAAAAAQQTALARQSASPDDAREKKAVVEAARLVSDGPDKPFLDLYFFDELHGFVVGAYNLIFETHDGGAHWRPRLDALDNPRGNHLYAIAGQGDVMVIAGEQGVVFRSDDAGRSFTRLATPYAGSFFTATWLHAAGTPDALVLGGLRGNAWRSVDGGLNWQRIEGLPPVSLLSAASDSQGRLWIGNQAGQIFVSLDGGQSASAAGMPPLPLTQLLTTPQGMVATTMRGVIRISQAQRP
jgi:photosystem II stability/assembly factor-like uncharacterized protein